MTMGLNGVRVLELCDEKAEFCGKLLAWMGAEVIKIEPPKTGSSTRRLAPSSGTGKSLYFEVYNQGKKSVTLDLGTEAGRDVFRKLVAVSDVLIESNDPGSMKNLGLDYDELSKIKKDLIMVSVTPFGQDGPWTGLRTSDLVSMSIGGISRTCGYDPVNGVYDTPPMTPNWGHSYQLGSVWAVLGALGALAAREEDGEGDYLDVSIYEAVSCCTEFSLQFWLYNGLGVMRQEGRHALPKIFPPRQFRSADGNYVCAYHYAGRSDFEKLLKLLDAEKIEHELGAPEFLEDEFRQRPENSQKISEAVAKLVSRHGSEEMYSISQKSGLTWTPVRGPKEILSDGHHRDRGFFVKVESEDAQGAIEYPGAPFICSDSPLFVRQRAPRLGENNREILQGLLGLSD
ncbi:MAG: CaiB/BaiF CoA transferase family protein [Nitrososphaerales archaeon]